MTTFTNGAIVIMEIKNVEVIRGPIHEFLSMSLYFFLEKIHDDHVSDIINGFLEVISDTVLNPEKNEKLKEGYSKLLDK